MTVTFFINYLNHHQQPIADEMYRLLGHEFKYVATSPRDSRELKGGEDYSMRPYCLLAEENMDDNIAAHKLVEESDVCVFGAGNLYWEQIRAKTDKLSFEMSERWFKRGLINIFSPRLLRWWWLYQRKLRGKKFYKLCSGAYTSSDCARLLTFNNRCFKWGYFPEIPQYSGTQRNHIQNRAAVKLIWVGRFINWKHPEQAVMAAKAIANDGLAFELEMYGDGDLKNEIQSLINKWRLDDRITLKGNLPNRDIHAAMADADIFLFTSDRNEGWGAVLNEAMGNGCCAIANDKIGSVPYLINNGINGLTYHNGSISDLIDKLRYALNHIGECREMGLNAQKDINTRWSPQTAAKNLILLCENLINDITYTCLDGPCSKV